MSHSPVRVRTSFTTEERKAKDLALFIQAMCRSVFIYWPKLENWQRQRRLCIIAECGYKLQHMPVAAFEHPVVREEALMANATTKEIKDLATASKMTWHGGRSISRCEMRAAGHTRWLRAP